MKQNINIEAEGGELIIRNGNSDYVIIPKKYRLEVQDMIKENCHSCIDELVETLPVMEDYAQDGSLYSEYLTPDSPTKKHPLDPNPDGSLPSYFKGSKENPILLNEVVVTEEAPTWLKYRREYEKDNPYKPYQEKNEYLRRFKPERVQAKEKIYKDEWERKRDNYVDAMMAAEKRINDLWDYEQRKSNGDLKWWEKKVKGVNTTPQQDEAMIQQQAQMQLDWKNKPLEEKIGIIGMEAALAFLPEIAMVKYAKNVGQVGKTLNIIDDGKSTNKVIDATKAGKKLIKPVSKVVGKTDDAIKAGSKVLNKEEALSKLSNEGKINLLETFNNLADKSKNISENVMYELNTLHKKLNSSYQNRAKEELKYANKWQEEWYNHPETKKRLQSLSDEFNTYHNQQIDEVNKVTKKLREDPNNLNRGYTQEELNYIFEDIPYITENQWTEMIRRIDDKNYISTFQSKNAKLQKILKGERRTHKGNHGVSGHYLDEDYSGARQNLVDKYSSKIKSTGIHEGNHGLTEGNSLIPKSEQEEMVKIFGKDKKIPVRNEHGQFNTYDEYLEDPTEIYARIMELREYMGKKPGELVSAEEIEKLIQFGKNGNTPVDSYFFSKIQDKGILKKLFNRLPAIAPIIGISYLQSQQQNKTEQ